MPKEEVVDRLPDVDPKALKPFLRGGREFAAADLDVQAARPMGPWGGLGVGLASDHPQYSLSDRVDGIQCPTLVTWAESDPIAGFAEKLYEVLTCPKTLVRFTNAEGAGEHCEMDARTLFHQRTFDWLDETLEVSQKR